MQPIVNISSKKRRRPLKTASTSVTKLRIMAALLLATVVIGMPFSVEAFVATSQANNDTYVIIREDLPTTDQTYLTRAQNGEAFVSLLRNQETIVKKLDSLAHEVHLMRENLGLQSSESGHEFEARDRHHHKPFDENHEQTERMQVLDEIDAKLTLFLSHLAVQDLDQSQSHKQRSVHTQSAGESEPRLRKRRSSPYIPNSFAFSIPTLNNHIPSLNLDTSYIESNHIDGNTPNAYNDAYGTRLTPVQPILNVRSTYASSYSDTPSLNSIYEDPQPMYGPLYDGHPSLYTTSYTDKPSLPGASYQEPALRYDALFDSQPTRTNFGTTVRNSYSNASPNPGLHSENEESAQNTVYVDAYTEEDPVRPSHGMKSMLQELLSLVRWLVRKHHQNQSSQNGYFTTMQHSLNQRLTSVEEVILGAMTTQTQELVRTTHQIAHEMQLERANFDFQNFSQIIEYAISNATTMCEETTMTTKDAIGLVSELEARNAANSDNATDRELQRDTNTARSERTNDEQRATIYSQNDRDAYFLSTEDQNNEQINGLRGNNILRSARGNKAPIWEIFNFADFLGNPLDDPKPESETNLRMRPLETSMSEGNFTLEEETYSGNEIEHSLFDPINATKNEERRISTENLNPLGVTSAAQILVLASELLRNSSAMEKPKGQQPRDAKTCISVNQTELIRSFTEEFQTFLSELKTQLGHSVAQNLAEDSLQVVLDRLLAPSVQRLEERLQGVQIYLDAAVLKLRHEFEAAISTSEASLHASLSASVASIVAEAVQQALQTAKMTALQIADATVTSVSSAAVASGHHASELLTGVIKRSATQVKNAIRQGVGGCPQHFTSIGGLCLKVPSIAPPVPFAPSHYSPSLASTSAQPPHLTIYNWTQARAVCRSYDGDLAVVPEVQDLIRIFRSLKIGSPEGFWLGAKRKRVVEDEIVQQSDLRLKLKWITGEYSEYDAGLKQKIQSKTPLVKVTQNAIDDDYYSNTADAVTGIPYTENPECLLLRTDHSLDLEILDCASLHRPLCQFIPTL